MADCSPGSSLTLALRSQTIQKEPWHGRPVLSPHSRGFSANQTPPFQPAQRHTGLTISRNYDRKYWPGKQAKVSKPSLHNPVNRIASPAAMKCR
jgi:hypothetical protein